MADPSPTGSARLAAAAAAIDAANAEDPTVVEVDGVARPLALAHGELAADWVQRLDPDATEVQLLAARAHHLRRWASPRSEFPEGRAGYLRWRTAAKRRHADDVAGLLTAAGYDDEAIGAVQRLIRKEGLGRAAVGADGGGAAVQTHEDAVCLAFLQTQLDPLAADLGDEKAVVVLAKTAAKMSEAGLAAAAGLALSTKGVELLRSALAGPT